MRNQLLKIISWIVVLWIMVHVLTSIVPAEQAAGLDYLARLKLALQILRDSISKADIPKVTLLSVSYMVYLVFLDTAATVWAVKRFNCAMTFREMLPARAITFLIAVINYQAGQVALPLYLKRTHKVPILEGTGSILFIALTDFFILLLMGFLGSLYMEDRKLAGTLLLVSTSGMGLLILHAVFWRIERFNKPFLKILSKIPLIGKLFSQRSLFHAFQMAHLKDHLITFCFRAPIHFAILFCLYLLITFFHEHVPFVSILIYMPAIMVISSLPVINVGSVGAGQAMVVFFFKQYAPEATLFAVSLVWALAINGLKVLIGAIFLTRHSRDLFRPE